MEKFELLAIADEYGTPAFVFDLGAFQARLRAVQDIVGAGISQCFAIKANPFLVRAAADAGARLEVCSPGELDICKALGIDPAAIVFSGVNKTAESVRAAADFGVGVLTAESLKHVALIEAEGARRSKVLDVLLRLNAGSQFGMSRDDLLSVIEHRADFPHLNIVGLHYFVGTQRTNLKHQRKELAMLAGLIDELRDEFGFEVQRLEYGPGLGVPLFEGDDFSDTLAPARELADDLRAIAARVQLTIEMGRFYATECGTYLAAVNDCKRNAGVNYCIVDGGINHLTYIGQMMGMKTPVIANLSAAERADAAGATAEAEWCLCGSLCTTNDVLARAAVLPDVREGDVLAFSNCGAYSVTEGVYLFLSRTMPRIIVREADGTLVLARDFAETSPLNTIE
ncbi:MAG: alanine racemase [Eggerthellaceae bacterium]|nr:alanine racemase [Eggerthellaceae bacterium]